MRLDEAGGRDLILVVGRHLTRPRMPYLVVSHHREMFAFELTSKQAKNLESHPDALGALFRKRPDEVAAELPTKDPPVILTSRMIDDAGRQVATAPVKGHCEYESSLPGHEGLALRMMYDRRDGNTVSHFYHLGVMLSGRGTLGFSMTPLKRAGNWLKVPPTLPVFFCLCRREPGATTPQTPVSNTCAALIDLA